MKGREALKYIEKNLEAGKTKKEIYEELTGKVIFRTDLLNFLAMVPDYKERMKYQKINMILFSLLVVTLTLKVIESFFLFISISKFMLPMVLLISLIPIGFAIMVWNFRGNFYRPLALLGIAGILQGFSATNILSNPTAGFMLGYLLSIAIIILAFFIGYKVFPYYGFWGMLKEDEFKKHLSA